MKHIALCLALSACHSALDLTEGEHTHGDSAPLINGAEVDAIDLPGTMQIAGNCTVSKIGERLILSAAHCVRTAEGQVRPDFDAGQHITVIQRASRQNFTIVETHLHPAIAELCRTQGCFGTAAGDKRDAPDLAVIEVAEDLTETEAAVVDEEPLLPGDPAVLVGYGCTSQTLTIDGKLRAASGIALEAGAIVHSGSPYAAGEATIPTMAGVYTFTAGPAGSDPNAPGLCPGDSGGPLFRKQDGKLTVVGVNASYTFLPGPRAGSNPVTNWHARVDAQARHDVLAWLQGLGAQTRRSCDHATTPCR